MEKDLTQWDWRNEKTGDEYTPPPKKENVITQDQTQTSVKIPSQRASEDLKKAEQEYDREQEELQKKIQERKNSPELSASTGEAIDAYNKALAKKNASFSFNPFASLLENIDVGEIISKGAHAAGKAAGTATGALLDAADEIDEKNVGEDSGKRELNGPASQRPSLEEQQDRYNTIDDYYSTGMSDTWKNLSDQDRRILLLDQIGDSLKRAGRYRPRLYGAFGKVIDEGQTYDNDRESMLQKGLAESFNKGLERRNERLSNQIMQQLKIANFPADIQMRVAEWASSAKVSNQSKIDFIQRFRYDVTYRDAVLAAIHQDPFKPIDEVIKAVDAAIPG